MTKRIFWGLAVAAAIVGFFSFRHDPVSAQRSSRGIVNAPAAPEAAFTAGNLVVMRFGDGSAALSNVATAAFLDEYTTAGTPVQSVAIRTTASGSNRALTVSGTATSEGLITRSTDGRYLVFPGYDAAVGTASITSSTSTAVNRVIGRADSTGAVDTTTALTDAISGGNPRGAASTNGTDLWISGTSTGGGIRYASYAATTSTAVSAGPPTNIRATAIFNGQLYVSSASGTNFGISTIGSGTPTTSGQTLTELPGFPTATGPSPYQFVFFNASTIYVCDDRSAASGGGIQKWTLSGGTWSLAGTLNNGITTGCRGLTMTTNGSGQPVFYATTTETSANKIVSVTDDGTAFPGATFATIATAAANTAFRGIAFAPTAGAPVIPQHIVDFNGDGKTDWSILHDNGTNIVWVTGINGSSTVDYKYWGNGALGDLQEPGDYDGDSKTDAAVFRPSAQAFYILRSQTGTFLASPVSGINGDFVDDYDGDGKDDAASINPVGNDTVWTYTPSAGANAGVPKQVTWGYSSDYTAPGDYNGDGKADFLAQRSVGDAEGHAVFYIHYGDGVNNPPVNSVDLGVVFGLDTDTIVPGDYDGDGKTDIAVVRNIGGQWYWFYRKSSTGATVFLGGWGRANTDVFVQGDYDGDGKTDMAIWRPDNQVFCVLASSTGTPMFLQWGQIGDQATANYNNH